MRPAKEIPLTAVCGRALLADLPYSSAQDHESLLLPQVAQEAPPKLPGRPSQRSHLCDQQDAPSL